MMNVTGGNRRTLTRIRSLHPSIILVSMHVPIVSNHRTAHGVYRRCPRVGILILDAFSSSRCVTSTVQTKTGNCLLGSVPSRRLTRTVHTICQNCTRLDPNLLRGFTRAITTPTPTTGPRSPPVPGLAPQRGRILRLIKLNCAGHSVTRSLCVSRNAIGARIARLLGHLGLQGHTRLTVCTGAIYNNIRRPGSFNL